MIPSAQTLWGICAAIHGPGLREFTGRTFGTELIYSPLVCDLYKQGASPQTACTRSRPGFGHYLCLRTAATQER